MTQISSEVKRYASLICLVLVVWICIVDTQFPEYSISRRLTGNDYDEKHKDLFPLDARDWWGTILVGLGTMIAASGGIGGGGILVPLLILVYGFHPKYAIPLSNFTILGSSITNMVLNISKTHPDANRPLVDWDLILVMEPLTMGGAVSTVVLVLFVVLSTSSYCRIGRGCLFE